jgi:N-methylhydantoinase A
MRVATNVGGTFSDLVYVDAEGVRQAKVDTAPLRLEQGLMKAIANVVCEASSHQFFAHGSTILINALLRFKRASVALVTREVFRDVLEFGRGSRPDPFNFRLEKSAPFVPSPTSSLSTASRLKSSRCSTANAPGSARSERVGGTSMVGGSGSRER